MYLIIGSGRAALHFSSYFEQLKISFSRWDRRSFPSEDLALSTLHKQLENTDSVLLLISDTAIADFAKQNLSQFKGKVIHASGALEIPGIYSAHPLMSFGPRTYSLEKYQSMYFCLSSADCHLSDLIPEINNKSFFISSEHRALYHAWASYCGNFATLLWQEGLPGFAELGVPNQAIESYLTQILDNSLHDFTKALTGPIARNDLVTIEKHLAHLPNNARLIYQSFIHVYAPHLKLENPTNANP